ncbi:MAG: response regulator transcription factor [Bacteroidota bacterium]
MARVLLVDDHEIVLDGISYLLQKEDTVEVIGQTYNGQKALDYLNHSDIDLVITDINMPVMNGIELAKTIRREAPNIKIIMLTMSSDISSIQNAIQAGVDGYILKSETRINILFGIRRVLLGEEYFSDEVIKTMINSFREKSPITSLTKRELEILKLIAQGFLSKEIAQKLGLSISTVNTHRKNLIEKTGSLNSQSLVKYALDNNLIN